MTDSMAEENALDRLSTVLDDTFGTSLNEKVLDFKRAYNDFVPKVEESIREGLEKGAEVISEHVPWLGRFIKKHIPDTLGQLKKDIVDKTNAELARYFYTIREPINKEIPTAIGKIGDQLDAYAEKYRTAYGDLVATMMNRDRIKNETLGNLRRKIQADQDSLKSRSENLRDLVKLYKTI
jgi:hypothetical protein